MWCTQKKEIGFLARKYGDDNPHESDLSEICDSDGLKMDLVATAHFYARIMVRSFFDTVETMISNGELALT